MQKPVKPSPRLRWTAPFLWTDRRFKRVADWLSQLAIIQVLDHAAKFAILVAVATFIFGAEERKKQSRYQAWQIIAFAHNQTVSGARKEALEDLNKDKDASLEYLELPVKADLQGINLENGRLKNVRFEGARLMKANFKKADLQDANLSGAKLQDADLRKTDLRGANFIDADLSRAKLGGAKFQEANFKKTNLKGVSGVEKSQIQAARNWILATYSGDLLNELKLLNNHNHRVDKKDFKDYDLSRADLGKADLCGADLSRANLIKTDLSGANLSQANLFRADLNEANLSSADLSGAVLSRANLSGAKFNSANLSKTEFQGANFKAANFIGASGVEKSQIQAARNWILATYSEDLLNELKLLNDHNHRVDKKDFKEYDLSGVNLNRADLSDAHFSGAILTEVKFSSTKLRGADLRGANLTRAKLVRADLSDADLRGGANLNHADLRQAILIGAKYDDTTILPENFDPEEEDMVKY